MKEVVEFRRNEDDSIPKQRDLDKATSQHIREEVNQVKTGPQFTGCNDSDAPKLLVDSKAHESTTAGTLSETQTAK